jgi:hypothetical protein
MLGEKAEMLKPETLKWEGPRQRERLKAKG